VPADFLYDDDDAFRDADEIARRHADDATAVNEFPSREQRDFMRKELDLIVADCAAYCYEDGRVYVDAAMDYLDRLAMTPGLLQWLLIDPRLDTTATPAERDRRIEAEFAGLVRDVNAEAVDEPTAELPLTCPAPEAHAQQARRTKGLYWLRGAGLLDRKLADPCPVCRNPLPRSHRRNG
jgi:hypothetical protein